MQLARSFVCRSKNTAKLNPFESLRRGLAAEPNRASPSGTSSSEDLDGFRSHVREFVRSLITQELAESIDKNNEFPPKSKVDLWKEMGNFGLLGASLPWTMAVRVVPCGQAKRHAVSRFQT